jgi:N-methylhydantoinase A/oxoprolinase/acetone carboxylase beta subunit
LTVHVGSRLKIPMVRMEARGPSRSALVKIAGENVECPVIERVTLHPGSTVPVPSLVVQDDATTYIPPGVTTKVAPTGDLLITGLSR